MGMVLCLSVLCAGLLTITLMNPSFLSPPRGELHQAGEHFPLFKEAVFPVGGVPNWGAMQTSGEWNRTYAQIPPEEFVPIPAYDLDVLTTPLVRLLKPRRVAEITAKLFYSTRYFGAYDLDAGEFTGRHSGLDLKLARGTPIGAIAGGRIHALRQNATLGLHLIIEHRLPEETFFSIYGHLETVDVSEGDNVQPGQAIGTVGTSGNVLPHLHLQIDRGQDGHLEHIPYVPADIPPAQEAALYTVHPIRFIEAF